jgi:hypothetical protein
VVSGRFRSVIVGLGVNLVVGLVALAVLFGVDCGHGTRIFLALLVLVEARESLQFALDTVTHLGRDDVTQRLGIGEIPVVVIEAVADIELGAVKQFVCFTSAGTPSPRKAL